MVLARESGLQKPLPIQSATDELVFPAGQTGCHFDTKFTWPGSTAGKESQQLTAVDIKLFGIIDVITASYSAKMKAMKLKITAEIEE